MITVYPYPDVDNDLKYSIDKMNLVINFTKFKNSIYNITNSGEIVIPFTADSKYEKVVSIYLTKKGRLIVDEPFNSVFYLESPIPEKVDKICWFTIPINFTANNGLMSLDIYAKGGIAKRV